MANTRDVMGEQACLDALISGTLTNFEDDGCTVVGYGGLSYHNSLETAVLPSVKSINISAFSSCINLTSVDMLGGGVFSGNALRGCVKLKHLVLRSQSMTSINHSNALDETAIYNDEGGIYVHPSLVDTYKAHSTWGKYLIFPLSEYPRASFVNTITDTWAEIAAACGDGTYDSAYEIGDEKELDLGTEGTLTMVLVAKDEDVLASDPTQHAHTTWVSKQTLATKHRMNQYDNTGEIGDGAVGGWAESELRGYLTDTIAPLLPSGMSSLIKPVVKYSDTIAYGDTTVTHDSTTTDSLWIPSYREVFGGTRRETTGPTYAWLSAKDVRRVKANGGSNVNWWLRTAASASMFMYIANSGGSSDIAGANSNRGVALGFCI